MKRTTTLAVMPGMVPAECSARTVLFTLLFFPAAVRPASLEPATSKAWEEYVESANKRMEQRLGPGKTFLWADEAPDRLAKVRAGEIVVAPVGPENPNRVPSGLIHDWVGAVFIAHVTLNDVLPVFARLRPVQSGVPACRD